MLGRQQRKVAEPGGDDSATLVLPPEQEPLFPPLPAAGASGSRRRRWPYLLGAAVMLLAAGVGGGVFYLSTRGPDLQVFEQGLGDAGALAVELQRQTDALDAPSDLADFRVGLARQESELARLDGEAITVSQAVPRAALVAFVDAEEQYLRELTRLAELDAKTLLAGQLARARELAVDTEAAYTAARAVLPSTHAAATSLALSPAALERVLSERRAAWITYERELAKAQQVNRRRATQLATLQAFTGRLDGIIDRYSTSRNDLSDWIAGVNSHGASFGEAYQVLEQQAERRRQLRTELAALQPPAAFAGHVSALLALIDRAIEATEAASRGIGEYQFSTYWDGYTRYDETPGWLSFQQASGEISESYGLTLSRYQQAKRTLTARLAKKVPLPKPPAD
jgi:hypothetical protein